MGHVYSGCCKRVKRKVVHWVDEIVCRHPAPLPCGVPHIQPQPHHHHHCKPKSNCEYFGGGTCGSHSHGHCGESECIRTLEVLDCD